MFENRDEAYFWFFILSAGIHAGSAFLYLVVHEKQKEAREIASATGSGQGGAPKKPVGSNVPAGAKLCDRALFGEEVYDGSDSLADVSTFSSRSRRRSYTKELAVQRIEDYRRLEAARELQPQIQSQRYS